MSRLRKMPMLAVGLAVVLAGCGGTGDEAAFSAGPDITTTSTNSTVQSTTTQSSTTTTVSPTESSGTTVPDYAAFIAAVDGALVGTSYEDTVLDNVEVYVATAELFCSLLDEGMTIDEALTVYLDRLAEERETEVDESDGTMAGVVLGAAVEVVCPHHSDKSSRP